MTSLHALFLPETLLLPEMVRQELFFFDKIYHYQPCEEDATVATDPWKDICEGYPPVPFHDDLKRFKQLITELKGNEGEFYSGQLSDLSSRFSANRDEKSVRSLISSISGKDENKETEAAGKKKEDLWQARLLLKLSEILYEEELEMTQALTAISSREKELFEALKGEEEEIPFSLSPIQPPPAAIKPELMLKAWAKLFLADSRLENQQVLACGREEIAERLFDINESLSKQRPVRLLRIPLPTLNEMTPAEYLDIRHAFRREALVTIDGFTTLLSETGVKGIGPDTLKNFTGLAADWTRILAAFTPLQSGNNSVGNPAQCTPLPHLEIYLCNRSAPALMRHLLRRPLDQAEDEKNLALIAVKSIRQSTCKG
ncbi:MAG: hypothetical protein V1706_03785 [Pseudomonadota bacterium]